MRRTRPWVKSAMTPAIEFPAVHYFDKGLGRDASTPVVMRVVENADALGRCSWKSIVKRRFDSGELLDSIGRAFPVNGIRGHSLAGPWWRWPIDWFEGTLIRADLVLGEPKLLTLDQFKERLCGFVDQERELWASGIGPNAIKRQIMKADSARAAIGVILGE